MQLKIILLTDFGLRDGYAAVMKEAARFVKITDSGEYEGEIIYFDHFGNAITNLILRADGLSGPDGLDGLNADRVRNPISVEAMVEAMVEAITLGSRQIQGLSQAYAEKAPGELLAIMGSHGLLEIALREDNAKQALSLKYGDKLTMKWMC